MPTERPLDGVDLSPAIFEGGDLQERPLYWAALSNGGVRSEAMREDDWKLVVTHPKAPKGSFENEKVELYNLAEDRGESVNLWDRNPAQRGAMMTKLKAWLADTQATMTPQPGGWLEAAESEKEN